MKYGLEFAGAKRVRRSWGWTLVTLLTLLALSALAGWLWSCVRVSVLRSASCGGLPLAWVPVSSVVAFGVVTLCAMLLIGLCVRAWIERCAGGEPDKETMRQSDDGTMRLGDFETAQAGSLCHEEDAPVPYELVDDPLAERMAELGELMPAGMTHELMVEILKAISAELQIVRRMCEGAARTLSVEDYGDSLAGAVKRLAQLRVTVHELRGRFTPDNQTVRGGDNEPRAFDASLSHGLPVSWSGSEGRVS